LQFFVSKIAKRNIKSLQNKHNPNKVSLLARVIQKKEVFFSPNNSKEKQSFVTERHSKQEIKSFKTKQAKTKQRWLKAY
jgi:hypothetical protein